MQDWECMTDLLIEEPGPKEEDLDDKQETSLIEVQARIPRLETDSIFWCLFLDIIIPNNSIILGLYNI